jgi:3-oxoacyl-[acyl-carrier protein] reductase
VSPGSIASASLVDWAASVGVDGNDPYRLMDAIAEHFGHPADRGERDCRTKWVRWWHF